MFSSSVFILVLGMKRIQHWFKFSQYSTLGKHFSAPNQHAGFEGSITRPPNQNFLSESEEISISSIIYLGIFFSLTTN